jgi:hypothetical protein
MDWFAPRRVMAGLVRPGAALLLVAGAVTGAASFADRPLSDPDHPRFVNAFAVEQVESEAVLERAPDRFGRLTVTERLTGSFGDGTARQVVRVLPLDVDGHHMPVAVVEVSGPDGAPAKWHAAMENDALVLRITGAPTDTSGTFTVTYRRDGAVVDTGGSPHVVWDVRPKEWPEDAAVSGSLTVPGALAAGGGEGTQCTAAGSACHLTSGTTAEGTRTYALAPLSAGTDDEVLVDVQVGPRLFAANAVPAEGAGNATLVGIGAGALALAGAGAALAASRRRRGAHESVDLLETVVPERLSPAMAGSLVGSPGRGIVGQLLAAAVAGQVRLWVGDEDVLVELVEWP